VRGSKPFSTMGISNVGIVHGERDLQLQIGSAIAERTCLRCTAVASYQVSPTFAASAHDVPSTIRQRTRHPCMVCSLSSPPPSFSIPPSLPPVHCMRRAASLLIYAESCGHRQSRSAHQTRQIRPAGDALRYRKRQRARVHANIGHLLLLLL
jgi:hypothetical protein